jgi:anti-repressor protein
MGDLIQFNHPMFGTLPVMEIDGKAHFPATTAADMLGYSNPHKAIGDHCRYLTKREVPHPQNPDKTIEMNFIPEGDLYRLIARSQLPEAERFEVWVFDDVLPSIRRHGVYATPAAAEAMMNDPDAMIRLFEQIKMERLEKEAMRIEKENLMIASVQKDLALLAQAPKVLFADSVAGSADGITVREMAKLLNQNGIQTGEKRLYDWLREKEYVIKDGRDRNRPTQKSMDLKIMCVRESTRVSPNGNPHIDSVTLITGKGQVYLMNKLRQLTA